MRLRVKDIDFENHQLIIRDGKGENDRMTLLPNSLFPTLKVHLEKVRAIHQIDLKEGYGEVFLPYALARKYPNTSKEFAWQYVFLAATRSVDPVSKRARRHHLDVSVAQKAIRVAA